MARSGSKLSLPVTILRRAAGHALLDLLAGSPQLLKTLNNKQQVTTPSMGFPHHRTQESPSDIRLML
eukprot:11604-Amphidinium_carterae.1